jgi:uncharacterized protein YjiS (DUF1127 family)
MKYQLTETDTRPWLLSGLALWWEHRRQQNDLSGIELRTLRDLGLTEELARREAEARWEARWSMWVE